jgi:hypothetical protein
LEFPQFRQQRHCGAKSRSDELARGGHRRLQRRRAVRHPLRRDDGAFTNWLGQPNGGFVSNDAHAWAVIPTNWQVVGTGDFNGDGKDDVLWRRDDGAFTAWLAKDGGGFVSNDANSWA